MPLEDPDTASRGRAAGPRDGRRRRLVVNGDDFGLAPEVNQAIVRAHRDGILTSTSLMVAAPAAREAVALARAEPRLAVGLHLVLVQGRSALRPESLGGLARADGSFREQAILAGIAYFFRPALRAALRREVRAQLEAHRSTGLALSHVDGHLNIHLHPFVQQVLVDLAPEFGIRAVRLTREPIVENLRYDPRHAVRKTLEGVVFRILSRIAERRFARLGVTSTDHLFGLHQTGACDEAYLAHLLRRLPPGDSELYCHPAQAQTAEMRRMMPGYTPAAELAALTAPSIRALVDELGIELVSYPELVASR
jgi:hopanoid biosynthesis associated protein HpnK